MIIKGNSVGHPLPDPRKGLEMHGDINMNGQRLRGLNAPVADDEPATKGYAVAKENVVNNFATTEEGFVADARALKALNDAICKDITNTISTNPSCGVSQLSAFKMKNIVLLCFAFEKAEIDEEILSNLPEAKYTSFVGMAGYVIAGRTNMRAEKATSSKTFVSGFYFAKEA